MLLTDARRAARIDARTARSCRSPSRIAPRWDHAMISEGVTLVEAVLPAGPVGPYQLQAAIAAVHAEAPRAEDTDWASDRDALRACSRTWHRDRWSPSTAPSPSATSTGPKQRLTMLEPARADPLGRHHRLHAVRAHLLDEAGRPDEARTAFRRAAALATSIPEQRYLNERGR